MAKVASADAVIWMDEMAYERHGFVNRNRFADGAWMTVPVAEADTFAPINRVRIADPTFRYREKVARTLEARLGGKAAQIAAELRRPYELLVGLNMACLRRMTAGWPTAHHLQSHLAAGRYEDVSVGLAAMVAEVGGDVWLSGPSGRRYLDEEPFVARGIEVRYFDFDGPNPCALEVLTREVSVAA